MVRAAICVVAAAVIALVGADAFAASRSPSAVFPRVEVNTCEQDAELHGTGRGFAPAGTTAAAIAVTDVAGDEEDVPVQVLPGGQFAFRTRNAFPRGLLRCTPVSPNPPGDL